MGYKDHLGIKLGATGAAVGAVVGLGVVSVPLAAAFGTAGAALGAKAEGNRMGKTVNSSNNIKITFIKKDEETK